jgi:hypothetical protein
MNMKPVSHSLISIKKNENNNYLIIIILLSLNNFNVWHLKQRRMFHYTI